LIANFLAIKNAGSHALGTPVQTRKSIARGSGLYFLGFGNKARFRPRDFFPGFPSQNAVSGSKAFC